jgi:hypothetical protein
VTPTPAAVVVPPTYSGYTGVPGALETLVVLGVAASAAWVGVRTGMSKQPNTLVKTAGWVGGIGSGLLGLLYLGQKAGINSGLPKVQVIA